MCKLQQPIVDRLSNDRRFATVKVFRVDFDKERAALRQWKVLQQGTLIAFKGKTEKLRSTGAVEEADVRKIFEAAL